MTTELLQVIADDGTTSRGEASPALEGEQLQRIYRVMVTTRLLDERAHKLQRQGRIGFYLQSTGQEASQVGSALALEESDWLFPSYRDPGILLLRGITLQELLHQCYGNVDDNTKGRQMPVHYSFARAHLVSISSPIGTQIVQAAGAAMAAKVRGDSAVAMTWFGDGATSSNDFHSGLNFAGVYAAPCVFVCENNGWAISLPLSGQTAAPTLAAKAEGYGMPALRVDGNDVLAVYSAARQAVDRARSGGGPTLIEAVTYRLGAHSSSDDPTRYRDEELVEEWARRDPIARFRRYLEREGHWDEAAEQELRSAVDAELRGAIDAAERAGPPPLSSLFQDVYAEMTPALQEQWDALRRAYEAGVLTAGELGEFPL